MFGIQIYLALNNNDASLVINAHSTWMLENIGTELAKELPILIVHLDLVGWGSLGDDEVSGGTVDGHTVWIQQLSIALSALSELELEATFLVKHLDAVVVGVGDDDVSLSVHSDARWLGELPLHDAKLTKFAVIDHLGTLDLRS